MPSRRERRVARKRRRQLLFVILGLIAALAAVAAILAVDNSGPPAERSRRNEATLLLAALNNAPPLTIGFDATYVRTADGTSTTTRINGAGRFVGPDESDLTATVEPDETAAPDGSAPSQSSPDGSSPGPGDADSKPFDVGLLHSTGKRFLSIGSDPFEGGNGSVLPGVAGSFLDGLRTMIELDTLASSLELRGSGADMFLEATVKDANAGITDPPPMSTEVTITFDADGLPTSAAISATGEDGDESLTLDLNMVFLLASDTATVTIPSDATDGPGSAQQFPVLAERLRVPYGYPPPVEIAVPPSTTATTLPGAGLPTLPPQTLATIPGVATVPTSEPG